MRGKSIALCPSRFYGVEVPLRFEAVTFEVADASAVAAFWAGLLGREVVAEPGGALVPGDDTQVGLRFVTSRTDQVGPRRLHLHLTSTSLEDQQQTVETALAPGRPPHRRGPSVPRGLRRAGRPGRQRALRDRAGQQLPRRLRLPRRGHLRRNPGRRPVLARRAGLAAGVGREPGDRGPVAARRHEGLVGRPPVAPKHGRNRQRFDLVTADPSSKAERLVSLGATVSPIADGVELADPDGNEFGLRAG